MPRAKREINISKFDFIRWSETKTRQAENRLNIISPKYFIFIKTPSDVYAVNFRERNKIPEEHIREAANDGSWVRFINVRHPLARLYSGWNNNLANHNPMARRFYNQMRLSRWKKKNDAGNVARIL